MSHPSPAPCGYAPGGMAVKSLWLAFLLFQAVAVVRARPLPQMMLPAVLASLDPTESVSL